MTDISATVAATAASVTGEQTPTNVRVNQPTKESARTIMASLAVASFIGLVVIAILAFRSWPDATAGSRINWLGIMGCMAIICIPTTQIAFTSSRLGRIEAQAGDDKIVLEGRASGS
jgi:hypothetical protein